MADRYELSAEKVLINRVTREALYGFTDVKELNRINEDIRSDLSVFMDVLRSQELSFVMTLPHLYEGSTMTENPHFEEEMVDELRSLYDKSRMSRIGFWYYLAYIEHCTNHRDHNKALEAGL